MSNKNIRVRIKNILDELNIREPAIDPEMIANHFKLKVEYEPFQGDISGCLLRDKEGGAIIGINSTHHKNRQRFTIAHELGHYLLHKGEPTFIDRKFERINFRLGSTVNSANIEEIEANQFAAELLMPHEFLIKDIATIDDLEKGNLISDLSQRYQVSEQALTIRLTSLSIP